MQKLIYLITYPLLWGISKLPYRLFYGVSDVAFWWVYHVIGYRKKVVYANLRQAFPEKSELEIQRIRKKFYRHFCDLFLEMAKTISISWQELNRRFVLTNPQVMQALEAQGKSYIILLGHYNSYEWVTALKLQGMSFKAYGVYKRLKNRSFDKMIRDSRGRFGTHMLDKNEVIRQMIKDRKEGVKAAYGMIADQAPKGGRSKYWRPFFGREVPVFIGSEVAAKKLDLAVTYLKIEKVKRGYYQATLVPLTSSAQRLPDYQLTDRYFEMLQAQIRQEPAYYLWTHKRWKHQRKELRS